MINKELIKQVLLSNDDYLLEAVQLFPNTLICGDMADLSDDLSDLEAMEIVRLTHENGHIFNPNDSYYSYDHKKGLLRSYSTVEEYKEALKEEIDYIAHNVANLIGCYPKVIKELLQYANIEE